MQMYPRDGGYKEEYYSVVEEDYVFKDDCNYNRGSSMQMMKPDQYKHNYNQVHGHGGCNDHNKNERESYAARYSETWYEEEGRGNTWNMKNGYSGNGGKHQNAHEYSDNWCKEERRGDSWNMKNDNSGHGGKYHSAYEYPHQNVGMKHNGYGDRQGHRSPHREQHHQYSEYPDERNKRVSVWEFKSIVD